MVNNDIWFKSVFAVSEDGEKLGILPTKKAIEIARSKGLDLVIISATPSKGGAPVQQPKIAVARIMDYGKFKYERKKKDKVLKEKQAVIKNREVRLTPLIGDHDLQTKAKKVREFLKEGDRVKVSLKFRGRELGRKDLGFETLDRFYKLVEDIAVLEKQPQLSNGRFLDIFLNRDKKKFAQYLKNTKEKGDEDAKTEE